MKNIDARQHVVERGCPNNCLAWRISETFVEKNSFLEQESLIDWHDMALIRGQIPRIFGFEFGGFLQFQLSPETRENS